MTHNQTDTPATNRRSINILFLSFYAPPDLSACSFRASALFHEIQKHPHVNLQCLTTAPNRYTEYKNNAPAEEQRQNVLIKRFKLPAHDNGMRTQAFAFLHYAKMVRAHLNQNTHIKYDKVFATSSRLMTAALGASVAKKLGVPLHLDIRDLFCDTIQYVLPNIVTRPILPILRRIERKTFQSAHKIYIVSNGFKEEIKRIAPDVKTRVFTNGIDAEFRKSLPIRPTPNTIKILYAGNLGAGQGLDLIIPAAAKMLQNQVEFIVVGSGGNKASLEKKVREQQLTNVTFHNPVSRSELKAFYREADILFLHLNNIPAFEKVLPSKLFEYAALGRPILAGVAGHAAEFIKSEIDAAEVFSPCDSEDFAKALERLKPHMGTSINRDKFKQEFDREKVMKELVQDLLS